MDKNFVSKRIKELRTASSLSQSALAKKVGTTQQVIAQYESGQDMTITRFLEICEALQVTPVEFWED
jgi:transcriptional regulator with XRE-family HTH domain